MNAPLFLKNVIALIWDFDKTLIPNYMQKPLFQAFKVDEEKFWREVNSLPGHYQTEDIKINKDTIYLQHILTYVREGIFKDLNNKKLREFGKQLEFFPGIPEFFPKIKKIIENTPKFKKHEIQIEHYIISTGIRQIIMGSKISDYVEDVWACDFIENIAGPNYLSTPTKLPLENRKISAIGYAIDNTTKTRAIFEINKGTNKITEIDVNSSILKNERRIPFHNMIYIADGPSDIPVFSILNQYHGRTYAVYPQGDERSFAQVKKLQDNKRVQGFGEAVYEESSQTYLWLLSTATEIATSIVADRERTLSETVGTPPVHIVNGKKESSN
ncbi:haloacid dehalogenase-like hydrolase [bacterium]|nr:haloacid dehalogenase-like hydrolase [bacterium]